MSNAPAARFGGYATILLSALFFGTYGVWSRLMGNSFSPFFQAWVRGVIIVLVMLPFMFLSRSFRKIERRDWPQVGFYILSCVCTQVPIYYAYNHAPIATVQVIFYSSFVIASYAVGRWYLREQITFIKLVSILLAFAGLALVFGVSILLFSLPALGLASLNGIASGCEVSSSKKISDKYPPLLLVFWGWVFTVIIHLPLSLILKEKQEVPQFNAAWLWLLVYALVSLLAFWLVLTGYQFVDASIGGLIGLTEIIFGVIFGAIIFRQPITWDVAIGGLVIVFAAMLPDLLNILQGRKTERPVEPVREL